MSRVEYQRMKRRKHKRRMANTFTAAALVFTAFFGILFIYPGIIYGVFGEESVAEIEAKALLEKPEQVEIAEEKETEEEREEPTTVESAVARKAKASKPTEPAVAILVDDAGPTIANMDKWLSVDAPLTFAVIPYCHYTKESAERLYEEGFDIFLHNPTQNESPNSYSGKGQLEVGMSRETVFKTLDENLADIPHVIGINNHQGGAGCNSLELMTFMCEWAKSRKLVVADSSSSSNSQVSNAAVSIGLEKRKNQVFIDYDNNPDYIRKAMRQLADIAKENGTAIGICHFQRPNTPSVVGEMVRTLRSEGINFAFVKEISN